jgi:hypothetical protein
MILAGHGLERKFNMRLASFRLRAFCCDRRANARQIYRPTFDLQSNDGPTAKSHT